MTVHTHHEWSSQLATAARYRKAANRHRLIALDFEERALVLETDAAEIKARHEGPETLMNVLAP